MLKKSLFAAAITVLAATTASAESLKPVRDFRGNVAQDFRGNCLRTKWTTESDECGYEAKPVQPPMIQAQISYIDLIRQSIYFNIDKYNIDSDDINRMNQVMAEVNKSQGVQSVRFVGYADQFATYQYNQKLSNKRAESIVGYFKSRNYFTSGNVSTSYFGDTKPVTNCDPKIPKSQLINCRATDRRVDIEVELIRQRTEMVSPNDPRITAKYNQQVVVPAERLQPVQQVQAAPLVHSQQPVAYASQPAYAPQYVQQAQPLVDASGRQLPKSQQPGYHNAAGFVAQPTPQLQLAPVNAQQLQYIQQPNTAAPYAVPAVGQQAVTR